MVARLLNFPILLIRSLTSRYPNRDRLPNPLGIVNINSDGAHGWSLGGFD
jgi:hypothetical protein